MRIARIFFDQDMRQSFQGLHMVLRKNNIDPETLSGERVFIFMNRACTKFKLISGTYLVYYNNGSRRIPLDAIRYLPTNFGGDKLALKKAVEKSVLNHMGVINVGSKSS